jgi:hypothetical protein
LKANKSQHAEGAAGQITPAAAMADEGTCRLTPALDLNGRETERGGFGMQPLYSLELSCEYLSVARLCKDLVGQAQAERGPPSCI